MARYTFINRVGLVRGTWKATEFLGKDETGHYHYKVVCINCGLEAIKDYTNICKARICEICSGFPKGQAGLNEVYARYKSQANSANRIFDLTIDQVKEITSSDCHYCGCSPQKVMQHRRPHNSWGNYVFNGIDRKNNELGYVLENCLPCCEICNRAKRNMTYEEFIKYLNKIQIFRQSKIL